MRLHSPVAHSRAAGSPCVRSIWTFDLISLAYLLCLTPPLGVALLARGFDLFPAIAVSLVSVLVWQGVFAYVRKRRLGWDAIATALVFALIIDGSIPLWQAILGLSFGVVVGEQIFGGRGFGFLNPVVVALAFLTFSFPGTSFSTAVPWLAYATLPGAVFLILARLISWRMLAGVFVGLFAIHFLSGGALALTDLWQGNFLFIIIFLACDPAGSASTNPGRLANGLLTGALIWVFTPAGGLATEPAALIPAILLGSIFAPLIDTCVVMFNTYARRWHRG